MLKVNEGALGDFLISDFLRGGESEFRWFTKISPDGGVTHYQTEIVRADKTSFPADISLIPAGIEEEDFYHLILRDETQIRVARENELRLESLFQHSGDAVYMTDLKGKIIKWNQGAENIFGYTAKQVIGRHVKILIPADLQSEFYSFNLNLLEKNFINQHRTRAIRSDNKEIQISLSLSAIPGPDD